jgi:hypothetical protein
MSGLSVKRLLLTSSKNIKTYIYINTVVVADACGSFGYRANSNGVLEIHRTQAVKKQARDLMMV